ncbi:MAG: hypothetical protein K0B06_07085 [Brevefilum sp.]|nr:hypothetical protein [Brevefilum sp.]
MSESLNLFRLQKLDSRIDHIKTRLVQIDRALSDDRRIILATKKLEKAKEEAKKLRIELNQIEDKVEAQRIKRKTTQHSLFSGKIKNPKELQDLQRDSEALKRYIVQLEDEQLEVMIAYETAEGNLDQAQQTLDRAKGSAIEDNAALLGEQSKLKDELERLTREKEAVNQSIPQVSQSLYQKLREKKQGTAVVTVVDGGCGICGQSITPADRQLIRSSTTLVFCPSCGRILYEE